MSVVLNIKTKNQLEEEFESCRRLSDGFEMYVCFIDFNNFKQVNDVYGHEMGDFVIERFCNIINSNIRKDKDSLIRNGGDEFVLLLPRCKEEDARFVVNKIYNLIASDTMLIEKLGEPFTISIGCTIFNEEKHSDYKAAIRDADKLMYIAKQGGGPVYVIFSNNPQDLDIKTITGERNKTLIGIQRRDKFRYMFTYMTRYYPKYNRTLLVESVRIVWRLLKDRVLEIAEARLAYLTLENYREVLAHASEKQALSDLGRLSKKELESDLDPVKDSKIKSQEEASLQRLELQKLSVLEKKLEVAKEVEAYVDFKETKQKRLQLQAEENTQKSEAAKKRIEAEKLKGLKDKAKWKLDAAIKKKEEADALFLEAEELMKNGTTVTRSEEFGSILQKDDKGIRVIK